MSNTSNLVLPYLAAGQAQKHVTLNESLRRLDAIVQLSVVSATTTTQPGAPTDGAVYIVPAGKSGADWNAYANGSLGYYRDGAWEQISPREGWLAYVKDAGLLLHYTGAAWDLFAPGQLLTLSAADKLVGRLSSGAGPAEEIACTAAGRALIDDADARAQCETLGTWRVLAASAVASSVTGTNTKTALATISIPGGAIGANGRLRVTCHFSTTASTNSKTLSWEYGGSAFLNFTQNGATVGGFRDQREMANVNATNAQKSWRASQAPFGTGIASVTTGSGVDTTTAHDLVFYGTLANSGETITLESWLVELFHHA